MNVHKPTLVGFSKKKDYAYIRKETFTEGKGLRMEITIIDVKF